MTEVLAELLKHRDVTFWGTLHHIKPALVDWIHGDGLQIVKVQPIDARPDYYVVRIDSSVILNDNESLNEDDRNNYGSVEELILQMIEDQYDNIDRYKERSDGLFHDPSDDEVEPFEYDWPMLSWGGGSFETIINKQR